MHERCIGVIVDYIRAVIFDRDGVLTYFDLEPAQLYFRALLGVELETLIGAWQHYGAEAGFPRSVDEEALFWDRYWQHVCTDLDVSAETQSQAAAFDYCSVVRPFPDARPA